MYALVTQELLGGGYRRLAFFVGSFNDIVLVQQWLRTANTCPVCRERVKASPKPAPARRRPYRDFSTPSETNHGASGYTFGGGPSGRPSQANPPSNNGRPASFAAMVFDRLMSDVPREVTSEPWSTSSSQAPAPTRDARSVYFERMRAQHQQHHPRPPQQPPHTQDYHDMYIELPPPHELPYHPRVPPTSQPGPSRPTAGVGMNGGDGPGVRPFGFMSLRGQGSDSSMSSSSSMSFVDEVSAGHGASGRRSMAGRSGSSGSGSGSLFLDPPTMQQRRETGFPLVPPSSGTFAGIGGPPAPPTLVQQPQSGFDAHGLGRPPTGPTERNTRVYDALFHVEASRSSPSSSIPASQPRPMGMTNRIPIDEDTPSEDHTFGWNLYSFPYEPTRRRSGEGASSGPS